MNRNGSSSASWAQDPSGRSPLAAGRLLDDLTAGAGGRHRHQGRQPRLGDGHHRLPRKWRDAGARPDYRQPSIVADDKAL